MFSDVIFAIAVTLLAFIIKLPEDSNYLTSMPLSQYLFTTLLPQYQNYIISFLVIGIYGIEQHHYFQYIKRCDYILIGLNQGFLMCIVLLPVATSILDNFGRQRSAVMFYLGCMALTRLMKALLWFYTSSAHHLAAHNLHSRKVQSLTNTMLVPPLVFLFSIAIAYFSKTLLELDCNSLHSEAIEVRVATAP